MPVEYANVDEYIEAASPERQGVLRRLRALVREVALEAEEMIQYGMPYYECHGMLCAFAAQKQYVSFYLLNGAVVDAHRSLLAGLSVGKGCIRFKREADLPEAALHVLLEAAVTANRAGENRHC